jgi:hypothetical protein
LFPPLPRALTADPWTPSLRRATPAVWRPTTAEKRDWRSRHTATDRRQIESRDVTTGSDRHNVPGAKCQTTVLVCANLDGSEKRKLLVMGKSKHPRCFKNIKHLPVKYTHNRKAWMTSDIFISEIRQWDNELKIRTIVLMDNSTAHPKMNNVKNIKLVFLPPNTTSMLQPLDQGIINNLKVNFAKCWSLN